MPHSMTHPMPDKSVFSAIKGLRAVRSFEPRSLEQGTIQTLLEAAVQAPTAMHGEPWLFAVIDDPAAIKALSSSAKELMLEHMHAIPDEHKDRMAARAKDPDVNLFYNAPTVIAVYARPSGHFVSADCWLAAQNLMLAANALGLGTCVIGFALDALNLPAWKKRLGAPEDATAYVAIVVGIPESAALPPKTRKAPVLLRP